MTKTKSKKIRESARGKPCQMRIEGCMPDNETVVLAHLNGAGIGLKAIDIHGAYLCLSCHDIYDGRKQSNRDKDDIELQMLRAVINTQQILDQEGLI
jgi:hypothetical protein